MIELDERRQRAGHNSITHIYLTRPSYADETTQTDLDQLPDHVTRFPLTAGLNYQGNDASPRQQPCLPQAPPEPPESDDPSQDSVLLQDKGITREFKPRADLARHTYEIDYQDRLKRVKTELEDSLEAIPSLQEPRAVTIEDGPLYSLQNIHLPICEISATTFQHPKEGLRGVHYVPL